MRILIVVLCLVATVLSRPCLAGDLVVSAAASLTEVCQDLKPGFEASRPGTALLFNFAASGVLLRQMEQGAPVDVLLSADEETMAQAVGKGLADPAGVRVFAANELVVATPASAPVLGALAGLAGPGIGRIALGNPDTVPAGRYAREALTRAGLWETLSPRFIFAESVRQALDYLVRQEVDAALVYATDAVKAGGKVRIGPAAPTDKPVRYPAAVTVRCADPGAGKAFLDHLGSPAGQAVLKARGFRLP